MRQIRLFLTLVLTLIAFSTFPQVDLAQANFLGNCNHVAGSDLYRPDGVVIRYEARNQRLVLVSMQTGEIVRELETSLATSDLANLNWSPDCHTLFGTANGDAILWDTVKGGRAATFASVTPKNPPYWNPGRDNLILEVYGGSFLWNFRQGAPMLLDFSGKFCSTSYWYFDWQVQWDNADNQVLVAPNYVSGNAVIAYDQTSAQQITYYDNDCRQGPLKFAVTPDNQNVIVFTSENEAFPGYGHAITVWDRQTMQHVTVSAGSQSPVLPSQVALSADKRYLVVARIGTMRVWDLTALAADFAQRKPIHRHPIDATTYSVRFVGDTLVETTDLNGRTAHWDVLTGARAD